jgi:ribosome-associated protein
MDLPLSDDDTRAGPGDDERPSRSQQRREALATLELAEQLVALPPSRLARIDLPDDVREEIAATRRITAHVARKRQLAYLAKLMRRHDDDAFESAHAALGADRDRQRQEAAVLHRLEAQREQLLDGGDAAFGELVDRHPDVDRQHLRSLIRQARAERDAGKPLHAYRGIFRLLRELEDDSTP